MILNQFVILMWVAALVPNAGKFIILELKQYQICFPEKKYLQYYIFLNCQYSKKNTNDNNKIKQEDENINLSKEKIRQIIKTMRLFIAHFLKDT